MRKYITGQLAEDILKAKENEFVSRMIGDCWSVKKHNGKYYFEYLSGELAGKIKIVEISIEEYDLACSGNYNQDSLCIKYGVS